MKLLAGMTIIAALTFVSAPIAADTPGDATQVLFGLLDKGGCEPGSLAGRNWRISTSPVGAHGELVLGDTLVFEPIAPSVGVARKTPVRILRNGIEWKSENGWFGQCVRDGTLNQYIVAGDTRIDGCLHELAIGRLDHDNGLTNRVEIVFQDAANEKGSGCEQYELLHPGHAHGDED
jgi:hypothetical protein